MNPPQPFFMCCINKYDCNIDFILITDSFLVYVKRRNIIFGLFIGTKLKLLDIVYCYVTLTLCYRKQVYVGFTTQKKYSHQAFFVFYSLWPSRPIQSIFFVQCYCQKTIFYRVKLQRPVYIQIGTVDVMFVFTEVVQCFVLRGSQTVESENLMAKRHSFCANGLFSLSLFSSPN